MEIRYSKSAVKYLNGLDRPSKQRIKAGILGLTLNPPQGDIKRLQGYSDKRLRLRVGGYRVIYRYDREEKLEILQILNIDARGGVYK